MPRNFKTAKKKTLTWYKKKCWEAFSVYVRTRDWDRYGRHLNPDDEKIAQCITCGRWYPLSALQAGHFIPGRKNYQLFNEYQVNAQCYNCNHRKKGAWPEYVKAMNLLYGEEKVKEMIDQTYQMVQYKQFQLEAMTEDFKKRTKEIENGLTLKEARSL